MRRRVFCPTENRPFDKCVDKTFAECYRCPRRKLLEEMYEAMRVNRKYND
jgi:hypothetical protein